MCYEQWLERKQVTEALQKARKEADKIIDNAKSAPRPEPEKETRPVAEQEEAV